MYKCKFTCSLCGNHTEQDSKETPENWWRIDIWGQKVGVLELMVCGHCLPKPVYKDSIQGIMPMIRKRFANWWSER